MKVILQNTVCLFLLLGFQILSNAQPVNDHCENANEIIITGNGYGFGTFLSAKVEINIATRQRGEKCANELIVNGNCDKTVWFKFHIPTTRNISIKLTQQDSAIPQIFAGFNVYKIKDCNYSEGDLALNLTPLNKFGESGNTCLNQGWYYVQVGCKQKAKGELWMELTSATPSGQLYDNFNAPLDLGLIKDKTIYRNLVPSCATVEEKEALVIKDSLLNKSVYVAFTLPANSAYNIAEFSYGGKKVKYRVFRDTITVDSVNGNKPFQTIDKNNYFYPVNELCPINTNKDQRYFVQCIASSEDNSNYAYFYLSFFNNTNKTDLWNTPNTNDVITTNNSFTRTLTHYFNCDGTLKNHGCKNVIPAEFYKSKVYWNGNTYTDTFNIAGYTIINVSEAGTLTVVSKNLQNNIAHMYYALYSGDITKNCNLTFINSDYVGTFNGCVSPGTYTLVTISRKGAYLTAIKHIITQKKTVLNTVSYNHWSPGLLPDFTPSDKNTYTSSGINFNMTKDTMLKIDTLTLKGYFIYREFYLREPSHIQIVENNYTTVNLYVVKGRLSNGTATLIKDYIYSTTYVFQLPNCDQLDSGYYTIICKMDTAKKTLSCVAPMSFILIKPPFMCVSNIYNEPGIAYKINNNIDVLSSTGNKKNLDYVFPLPYCSACNVSTIDKPVLLQYKKKFFMNQAKFFTFYTFYLQQNAELRLPDLNDYNFELYKGDVGVNATIIKDSTNIVSACDRGNVYCNLEGGKYYTLVYFNHHGGNVNAYFTPHQVSSNDFADHAYDFGHFNANTSKTSTPIAITCHTGAYESDPCSWESGLKRCQNYAVNPIIPYKDTLNVKRFYGRKTLWYTFTVDNASIITAQVSANTTLLKNPKMNIYRYKGPYNSSFATILANNFDSSEKSMEWLTTNFGIIDDSRNLDNYATFNNFGCGPNRYFIILEDNANDRYDLAHYEYKIKLTYQQTVLNNKGDFCSNAIADSLLNYGVKVLAVNNTCHTYGNSPFEKDAVLNTKSTWFQIKIANMKSCDLKIRNTSGNGLLYYNVYGGSCQAMTRIAHLSDLYSYFTLSCMGKGTYYIQAVCNAINNDNIAFEVSAIAPASPKCKPYDFKDPIAQFDLIGGCNNDTVQFQNHSTSGSGITYTWTINSNFLSSVENPVMLLSNPLVQQKNTIRLLVTNTVDNLKDTISRTLDKDTNTYIFKITGPNPVLCGDTIVLKVNTNFPHKINYEWTDKYTSKPINTPERITNNTHADVLIYLKGESDNCRFSDSFLVKVNKTPDLYKDVSICSGQGYTIYAKTSDYFYLSSQTVAIQVKDSFMITIPGDYYIHYDSRGCTIYDTMHVEIATGHTTLNAFDSVYACNGSVKLKYKDKLLNYSWSTGDTLQEITVKKSGTYILVGDINSCKSQKYTITLKLDSINTQILNDRIVCKYDVVTFTNPLPGFTIVNKNPAADNIVAIKSFKESMTLKKDRCIISDSALITVNIPVNRKKDTLFCKTTDMFSMTLDAGMANAYLWRHDQGTTRYSTITALGKYIVERTDLKTCRDTMTFNVLDGCPFQLFIPNAFTPNGDTDNEFFGPVLSGPYTYSMRIFNRWGEILFETENSERWNGFYMDELVQQSVYCYQIVIKDYSKRKYNYSGTFLLLR